MDEITTADSKLQVIRAVCADAALALVIAVGVTLVIASLAAAGIITMSLAYMLLILAWAVSVGGSFLVPWEFQHKHRAIFAVLLGFMLIGVGWYETEHYEKPPNAKDVADEVAKLLAPPPHKADRLDGTSSTSKTNAIPHLSAVSEYVPLQSKLGKMIFRCLRIDNHDNRTIEQIQNDVKERIVAARGTFGVAITINEILGGRQIIMTPATNEGLTRMAGVIKWTLEIRKSGPEALITSIIDYPEPLGSLSKQMPVDPTAPHSIAGHVDIEKLIGNPENTCQLI